MVQTTARIVTLVTLVLFFSACSKKPAQIPVPPEQAQAFAQLTQAEGEVAVTVTKDGDAYEIRVDPWVEVPPAGEYFETITWIFTGAGGVEFNQVSLNFKEHDNFEGSGSAPPYRLTNDPDSPSSNLTITGTVKNPVDKDKDYTYIIDVEVKDGPKIEVDPGYRVWP